MLPVGEGITASAQSPVLAESSDDTFANLHPNASNVFSPITTILARPRDVAGVEIDLPDEYHPDVYLKSISSDGKDGFVMTFAIPDGNEGLTTREFAIPRTQFNSDAREFVFSDESGDYVSIWSETDSFKATLDDGTFNEKLTDGSTIFNYLDILGWVANFEYDFGGESIRFNPRAYTIYGTQTDPVNLPIGTATYDSDMGRMLIGLWDKGDKDRSTGRTFIWTEGGALSLTADFDQSKIIGMSDQIWMKLPSRDWQELPDTNQFQIENGRIAGNRFHAELKGVDSDSATNKPMSVGGMSGAINGGFYGPDAEEIGGAVSGTHTDGRVFTGYIATKRAESE